MGFGNTSQQSQNSPGGGLECTSPLLSEKKLPGGGLRGSSPGLWHREQNPFADFCPYHAGSVGC